MKKALKYLSVGIGIILAAVTLFIFVSLINHRRQLAKEAELFVAPGELVEVNGHQLHVYAEGESIDKPTLIFMAGGGTSAPVLDFKSLYSQLSDQYQTVVVEKAGYGFSEVADVDRDIDAILSETRAALAAAEIEGPFILLPHSMSGIEALYWAQEHPSEIKAIIGLDMAVPAAYENYTSNRPLLHVTAFAANVGVTRWLPGLAESDAIKYGTLTEAEKELYRVVFYRRTATKTMLNEVGEIKANASKVKAGGVPAVPLLLFVSNGEGTGWGKEEWQTFQENYIEQTRTGKLIKLDASHYVHDIEYEKIATETVTFISELGF